MAEITRVQDSCSAELIDVQPEESREPAQEASHQSKNKETDHFTPWSEVISFFVL